MPNLTSVTLTSGVPTAGTGTVSTLDAVLGSGNKTLTDINTTLGAPMQATGGTVTANAGTNLNTATLATAIIGASSKTLTDVNTSLATINTTLGTPVQNSSIAAKGTPGTPSSDVISMQGVTGMFAVTTALSESGNMVSGTQTSAMTDTSDHAITGAGAPGTSLRNYITTLVVSNSHASVDTDVVIKDGAAGTVLITIPAAHAYGGAAITFPTPLKQPTTNTALYAACLTTGASVKVSVVGYKGA